MSNGICPSLYDLFHLASSKASPSILLQTAKVHSFYDWIVFHIFFIFSFVDGHLGSFHILTIVNSPTIKSGMHVCFQIRVFGGFLDESSGVEFLAPMLVLFLVFWET